MWRVIISQRYVVVYMSSMALLPVCLPVMAMGTAKTQSPPEIIEVSKTRESSNALQPSEQQNNEQRVVATNVTETSVAETTAAETWAAETGAAETGAAETGAAETTAAEIRATETSSAATATIATKNASTDPSAKPGSESSSLWAALRKPGHFAMMRHAVTSGSGEPQNVDLRDCTTQRNLSAQGRQQAQRISAQFHAHGIARARLYSSEYCRCRETAELLNIGDVQTRPELNAFADSRRQQEPQIDALLAWLEQQPLDEASDPLVLVSHQPNITALTREVPRYGELLVIQREGRQLKVLGRIRIH